MLANKLVENLQMENIRRMQLDCINTQLLKVQNAPAYKGKLPTHIDNLEQMEQLPFTTKDDLRDNFPYGYLSGDHSQIVRFNCSSGTTGIPTLYYVSKKDLELLAEKEARLLSIIGASDKTIIQNMTNYGLFSACWAMHEGATKLGAKLIPASSGNTERQILLLETLCADFTFSCPSYLQHLLNYIKPERMRKLKWSHAITGGEPLSPEFKSKAKDLYGIDIFNFYGMTESGGHIAAECPYHKGLHIVEDYFYVEIIDPDTGKCVPDGEYGEIVFTSLKHDLMPLIRYRTRDISRIITDKCPCGSDYRLLEPITHRSDSMLNVNGVNIFPSQIDECIYAVFNSAINYQINIKEQGDGLKKMVLDIEVPDEILSDKAMLIKTERDLLKILRSYITISPKMNFVAGGTLPDCSGKRKVNFI